MGWYFLSSRILFSKDKKPAPQNGCWLFCYTTKHMQNTTQEKIIIADRITTTEFGLAVTLCSLGFNIMELKTDPSPPFKTEFAFQSSPETESAIDGYWNELHRVEPKAFLNVIRELKSRMRSTKYAAANNIG